MTRTAIALRHVAFEDLGFLGAMLENAGWSVSYRNALLDDLAVDPELLIVLGGPIGVYEGEIYPFVAGELALIERRLKAGKAVLGICLGAQMMAQALGARVYPGHVKEIGWGRVSLTAEGAASALAPLGDAEARVLNWHGDTYDLPSGAVRLAGSADFLNQAFSFGPSLALQFHLEAEPAKLENWFVGHAVELAKAGIDIPALRAQSAALAPLVERQAHAVFGRWLESVA